MRKFLLIPYKQHLQPIESKESPPNPEGSKAVLDKKIGDTSFGGTRGPDTGAIPEGSEERKPAASDTRPPTAGAPEKDQSTGVSEETSQNGTITPSEETPLDSNPKPSCLTTSEKIKPAVASEEPRDKGQKRDTPPPIRHSKRLKNGGTAKKFWLYP